MGCGCTKAGTATEWVYTTTDGKRTIFATETQARAAMIRAGNTGSVTPR